jgi:hypothetical protein
MKIKLFAAILIALALAGWGLPLNAPQADALPAVVTDVQVTVVTGSDGTENPLLITLFGPGGADPVPVWYTVLAAGPGDLQPGQTNTFTFQVPLSFCELIKVELRKPSSPGVGDDAWALQEFYISVDGVQVAFDTTAWEYFSPQTVTAYPFNLRWDGTQQYQNQCTGVVMPVVTLVPGGVFLPVETPLVQPPVVTLAPQIVVTAPGNNPGVTQPPPIVVTQPLVVGTQPPPQISLTQQPGQTVACPGFNLAARLRVGQQGRVLPGLPNRLRAQPNTTSAQLGTIPAGGIFNVIGGPVCDASTGILWWQVTYNGQTGWTSEGQGNTYWCEPVN